MEHEDEEPDIVSQAFAMAHAVERFVDQARGFYYAVMLSGYSCPQCGGSLAMVKEGLCCCFECQRTFDPTLVFQRCSCCGGVPVLMVRRYSCQSCGADVVSRFLFDGLVFDAAYFRQKMAECRKKKAELRERVRLMLAGSRSGAVPLLPVDLGSVPGLAEVLDSLVCGADLTGTLQVSPVFNLSRYQAHVNAYIGPIALALEQIPPLSEDTRRDRIWRFIAIIFLAHAGILDVWQDGQAVMVMKHETDRERPGVPGDLEEADGVEGAVGRAEA